MRRIRLDRYQTTHGEFDVWYEPRHDAVVQTGRDDLGHVFEDHTPAAEFVQDLADEDDDGYLAALIESVRQNRPEIMVQWGITDEAWKLARGRGDLSRLRAEPRG